MKGYHRWREGALALASLALLFLVLVAINFLAYRHPIRFDLSETKAFTLSPQTREVLASLKQNIQIRAYFESKDADTAERAKLLLTNYVQLSPKITFEIIDPWKNPAAARKMVLQRVGKRSSFQTVVASQLQHWTKNRSPMLLLK